MQLAQIRILLLKRTQLEKSERMMQVRVRILQHCAPRAPPESTRLATRVVLKSKKLVEILFKKRTIVGLN